MDRELKNFVICEVSCSFFFVTQKIYLLKKDTR